jgi:hypothetical protein
MRDFGVRDDNRRPLLIVSIDCAAFSLSRAVLSIRNVLHLHL